MKQRYNELNHDLCVRAVLDAFDGKWKRLDVMALVNKYGGVRYGEIADALRRGLSWPMLEAADGVALEIEQRIIDLLSGDPEAMDFEPVTVRLRPDGMTGKMRAIADLCPMLQIAGHLVKLGIEPLLKAKIEYGQCASIPGRGQTGLKRRTQAGPVDGKRAWPLPEAGRINKFFEHRGGAPPTEASTPGTAGVPQPGHGRLSDASDVHDCPKAHFYPRPPGVPSRAR